MNNLGEPIHNSSLISSLVYHITLHFFEGRRAQRDRFSSIFSSHALQHLRFPNSISARRTATLPPQQLLHSPYNSFSFLTPSQRGEQRYYFPSIFLHPPCNTFSFLLVTLSSGTNLYRSTALAHPQIRGFAAPQHLEPFASSFKLRLS